MTNEERYKTRNERVDKFNAFCKQYNACQGCPAKVPHEVNRTECTFAWLALEAEEEKPLSCPCCGAEVKTFHITRSELDQGYHVFCGRCGLQTALEKTPEEAVALWNKRMK